MNVSDILLQIVVFKRNFAASGDKHIFAYHFAGVLRVGHLVAPLVAIFVAQVPGVLFAQVEHSIPILRTTPQQRKVFVRIPQPVALLLAARLCDAFAGLGQQLQPLVVNIP